MGLFDKLKGAMNAVTGGAAKVTIAFEKPAAPAGASARAMITATSSGAEVKSGGVFIDVRSIEESEVEVENNKHRMTTTMFEKSFRIADGFVLAPNETKKFHGEFAIPPDAQPTYEGKWASHRWSVRGRLEALGNDPDSGFQPFVVTRQA
jgi:sporulation-control protein spo0M